VITFRQNPRRVLHPKSYPGDIYGLPRKLRILEELGVGFAVLIDFSGDFSRITGEEFTVLLRKRRISYLAVGANFRCGYHLDTSARQIREMMSEGGTRTELVSQLRMGGAPVSSSRIRQAVLNGDIAGASELLGRPYSLDLSGLCPRLEGNVFSWEAEGRVLPPAGLYSVFIRSGAGVFPAEISLDSGRLVLGWNLGAGGFAESEVPPGTGDFLNGGLLSIEFRP
jgi:riboflavin kinase/FMN adenylyltransferase